MIDYHFEESTLQSFYDKLLQDGVKKRSVAIEKKTDDTDENHTHVPIKQNENAGCGQKELPIRTLRQLFNILANTNPNDMIYNDTAVRDVYCGGNTAFLYTRHIDGLHLVHAQFHRYNKQDNSLFLIFHQKEVRK